MGVSGFPDLYLLRHGQTEWNVEGRLQGRMDSPLTARGIAQAERQAELLRGLAPDLLRYSSTAGRALQTARIVFGAQDFTQDARLQEIDVGGFTGAREADLRLSHPALFCDDPLGWYDRTPGGEHLADLARRVRGFLDGLHGPAIVVTHGITLRMIRQIAMAEPAADLGGRPVHQGAIHLVRGGAEDVIY